MGIDQQQQNINLTLSQDLAEARTALLLQGDALNAFEAAVNGLFDRLVEQQLLDPADPLIAEFRSATKELHKLGLPKKRPSSKSAGITCPGCKAVLKNVTGAAGEHCDWCGHQF